MKYFAIFAIFAGLSLHTNFKLSEVFTKEEAKEIRVKFWEGFKRYCKRKHIYRKWVLTGVKIRSTQLKFYADREKALVLFRFFSESCFESLSISLEKSSGSITAAAKTGPARHPLPASSHPASILS